MLPKIIDLTHTITPHIPTWDMSCGFRLTTESEDDIFKIQSMSMNCGIGTHIDAPAHCINGAAAIDDIPLDQFMTQGYMIDLSHRCSADNCLTVQDVLEFEMRHKPQWMDTCVLINTGWHSLWNTPDQYHNDYRFPYIDYEAASMLVDRGIRLLGIDTVSPDRPDSGFPVHQVCLSNNVLIVENVGNLSELPPTGFMVYSIPLKLKSATESPIRMWATC